MIVSSSATDSNTTLISFRCFSIILTERRYAHKSKSKIKFPYSIISKAKPSSVDLSITNRPNFLLSLFKNFELLFNFSSGSIFKSVSIFEIHLLATTSLFKFESPRKLS